MSLIGTHVKSDYKDLINGAKIVHQNGGNLIQIFANKFSKIATEEYEKLGSYLKQANMKCVIHASYTINLAQNWDYHSWWLKQFLLEIKIAELIGAVCIVVHLGKQLNIETAVATNNMYTSLIYILSKSSSSNIRILLETSAGQGSEMFFNLDELGTFIKKFSSTQFADRIGICIDTCHIFSAGYDIRGKTNIVKFIEKLNSTVGINVVKLVHLNDSSNDFNARIDRHANFGKGYIGSESIITIAKFFNKLNIPLVLETPTESMYDDLIILKKSL